MTPEEAINATTINSAYAMELEKELGSIAIGKKANLFITKPINMNDTKNNLRIFYSYIFIGYFF